MRCSRVIWRNVLEPQWNWVSQQEVTTRVKPVLSLIVPWQGDSMEEPHKLTKLLVSELERSPLGKHLDHNSQHLSSGCPQTEGQRDWQSTESPTASSCLRVWQVDSFPVTQRRHSDKKQGGASPCSTGANATGSNHGNQSQERSGKNDSETSKKANKTQNENQMALTQSKSSLFCCETSCQFENPMTDSAHPESRLITREHRLPAPTCHWKTVESSRRTSGRAGKALLRAGAGGRQQPCGWTGEDLAQGVGFWYAFLTSFWGAKTMVLSKREGLLPGPGLALSFWFPFFLELWLLYFLLSWCFFGRYLGCNSVPGQGLDSCVVVWLSFLLLFWLALSLLSWSLFCSLLLCSWVPGTRVGSLRGRFSSC